MDLTQYGITITEAYKDLSQHYTGQICVHVQAKGIFKGCRKIQVISESWNINDKIRLAPLYSYHGEAYIPKEVLAQWIKSLPVKYKPYCVDKLSASDLTTSIELANNVDTWIDILNIDGTPYISKLFNEVK